MKVFHDTSYADTTDRVVQYIQEYSWILLIFLGILTVIISCYGLSLSFQESNISYSFLDLIYISLQLFVLESGSVPAISNIWIQIARFLAPAVAATTFILLILIIFIDCLRIFWLNCFIKGHIIVCGLGYLGPVIVSYYRKKGKNVVVIESDPENKDLSQCKEHGIFTIIGDASDIRCLKKAKITEAERIFLVTGSDAINAEIAVKAYDIIKNHPRDSSCTCHTHIVDQNLCTVLRNQQMGVHHNPSFHWEFFNIYQIGGYCIQKAFPPGGEDILPEDLRILVIGVGRMGETLIVQLAKRWREQYGSSGKRFFLMIIDKNADDIIGLITFRHPSLETCCSIEALSYSISSPEFARGSYLFFENNQTFHQIYICINDSSLGLSAALQIESVLKGYTVPIIVRTTYLEGISCLFQTFQEGCYEYSNIFAFPLVSCRCSHELIIHGLQGLLARVIYDDYRLRRIQEGKNPDDDPAMVPWPRLDETYQKANLGQAGHIFTKITAIHCRIVPLTDWDEELFSFTDEEVEILAALEHERWNQDRLADGWMYGAERNNEKKKTPYLVPYEQLPEDIKEYDREPVRNIPMLLAMIDLKVIRNDGLNNMKRKRFFEYREICESFQDPVTMGKTRKN